MWLLYIKNSDKQINKHIINTTNFNLIKYKLRLIRRDRNNDCISFTSAGRFNKQLWNLMTKILLAYKKNNKKKKFKNGEH